MNPKLCVPVFILSIERDNPEIDLFAPERAPLFRLLVAGEYYHSSSSVLALS